ncbi:MAG: hypothetical protein ABIT76_08735 [Chthoniobacterales bacterium]
MMPATKQPYNCKNPRFPGILRAARELDVDRTHLYRVLLGQRVSHSLTARYHAFVKSQKGAAK